jgi:hypothetical protein
MIKIYIPFLVIILLALSCNPKNNQNDQYAEAEKIYKEAIEIHDEVMPMMGDIMKLQSILKEKKEEFSDSDREFENQINIALQNLENAHNGMMQWMRNITPIPKEEDLETGTSTLLSKEEMLEIQEKSFEEIKKVQNSILESIENARVLISELEDN